MAFREKTTFVIGAGASAEFGLPVGTGLATAIKKSANLRQDDGDVTQDLLLEIREKAFGSGTAKNASFKALDDIHEGIHTAVSIDAFIHRHRKDEEITFWGKILIALEVLKAERSSSLSPLWWGDFAKDPNLVLENQNRKLISPDSTWIGSFFRIMSDGIEDHWQLGKDVTIICFNYDRCIEVYLTETIADAYRIPIKEALAVVESNIKIIHPYGYLGKLNPVPGGTDKDQLSFGPAFDEYFDIAAIAENIQTYTEQATDVSNVWSIHEAIAECKNLIFLGFGFNNQNLDLLRVKQKFTGDAYPKNIYATGYGLYPQIKDTLTRRILDLFMDEKDHRGWLSRVNLEFGVGCAELFKIHDMNFSAFIQRVIVLEQEVGGMISRVERYSSRPDF